MCIITLLKKQFRHVDLNCKTQLDQDIVCQPIQTRVTTHLCGAGRTGRNEQKWEGSTLLCPQVCVAEVRSSNPQAQHQACQAITSRGSRPFSRGSQSEDAAGPNLWVPRLVMEWYSIGALESGSQLLLTLFCCFSLLFSVRSD